MDVIKGNVVRNPASIALHSVSNVGENIVKNGRVDGRIEGVSVVRWRRTGERWRSDCPKFVLVMTL